MMLGFLGNKKDEIERKGFFLRNGAAVLEQSIASLNGNCNPIRNYSLQQLVKATNNFSWNRMIHHGCGYKLFKGVYEDYEISVKKFEGTSFTRLELIANEVALSSGMSSHKNVLKLLGCCLEAEFPLLVYEFPAKGNLSRFIQRYDNWQEYEELPFETKLKIAIGLANATAFLHNGLSKTFIHRDITRRHVFLDEDYVPKLSEFRLSIPIPDGETHVDADVCGTIGFLAPEVISQGRYTQQSDAYNFGILLWELLEGKKFIDLLQSMKWNKTNSDVEEGGSSLMEDNEGIHFFKSYLLTKTFLEENRAQRIECAKVIERCLELNPDDRPTMIEVAKLLTSIKRMQF